MQADRSDFAELASSRIRFHGIALALVETRVGLDGWPAALRETTVDEAQMQALWEETHRRTLVSMFDRLAENDIRTAAMKGTALAYSIYANPAWRRRGDTDLLVSEDRLDDARSVLQALGFRLLKPPHGLLFQESWYFDTGIGFEHVVDLHWRVLDSPRLQTVLQVDDVLHHSIPLTRLHPVARAVDPVRALVQGAFNQREHSLFGYGVEGKAKPEGDRLIWAMDYWYLCRAMDEHHWQRLVQLADQHKIAELISSVLKTAQALCADCVPLVALAQLDSRRSGNVMAYLSKTSRRRRFASDLAACKGAGEKVSFIARLALPDDDHLRATFPEAKKWPTFALRLRWLARTISRHVKPYSS